MSRPQPKTVADEVNNGLELAANLVKGKKTLKGVFSELLDEAFGEEPNKPGEPHDTEPPAAPVKLRGIDGGAKCT